MEQRLVRKDIRDCQAIYYHSDYYLFSGNGFRSCAKRGGSLFVYTEVKTPINTIAPLPDNKLLVHDKKSVYHILDLEAGKVLVSKQMPRKIISTKRFAVSDDGKTAYRIWLSGNKYHLAVIALSDLSYRTYPYKASWSNVADLVYQSKDELRVLEAQAFNGGVRRNQITSVLIGSEECITAPVYQWESDQIGKHFDGRYVWESGCKIRDLITGEYFSLLENSDIMLSENHVTLSYVYYPEYNYVQLIDSKQNVFIDCRQRKIIARYFNDPQNLIYSGIYTGNEFWMGKPDGIYAMTFPVIEER